MDILEKAYADLPPMVRSLVIGLAVFQFAIIVCKAAIQIVPRRRKKELQEVAEEYLKVPKQPVNPVDVLGTYLREARDSAVFRQVTGIRCKKLMREELIWVFETTDDRWTWIQIASAFRFLILEGGELKYRVSWVDRIFQVFNCAAAATGFFLVGFIQFTFGGVTDPKDVLGVVVAEILLILGVFLSISWTLPLERARDLKQSLGLKYADAKRLKPLPPIVAKS